MGNTAIELEPQQFHAAVNPCRRSKRARAAHTGLQSGHLRPDFVHQPASERFQILARGGHQRQLRSECGRRRQSGVRRPHVPSQRLMLMACSNDAMPDRGSRTSAGHRDCDCIDSTRSIADRSRRDARRQRHAGTANTKPLTTAVTAMDSSGKTSPFREKVGPRRSISHAANRTRPAPGNATHGHRASRRHRQPALVPAVDVGSELRHGVEQNDRQRSKEQRRPPPPTWRAVRIRRRAAAAG